MEWKHVRLTTSGFTLLEVMVAMLMLAVVMLGTAAMLTTSLAASAGSSQRFAAATQAQGAMELLSRHPFDTISSSHAIPPEKIEGITYQSSWRKRVGGANIAFLSISTVWNDKQGRHGISVAGVRYR